MALERGRQLKAQTAVWWRRTGTGPDGEPLIAEPVEIDIRWRGQLSEVPDARGQVLGLDATALVWADVNPGDLLWKGRLGDWDEAAHGQELMLVTSLADTLPLRKGRVRRTLGMKRFRATLPAGS
jgi:hypothetical protein